MLVVHVANHRSRPLLVVVKRRRGSGVGRELGDRGLVQGSLDVSDEARGLSSDRRIPSSKSTKVGITPDVSNDPPGQIPVDVSGTRFRGHGKSEEELDLLVARPLERPVLPHEIVEAFVAGLGVIDIPAGGLAVRVVVELDEERIEVNVPDREVKKGVRVRALGCGGKEPLFASSGSVLIHVSAELPGEVVISN